MEGPKVNMQNLKRWKDKQLQTSTSKHQGLATPMEEWVWTVFFSQGCGRVLKSDAKLLRGFGILVVLKTGFSISTNILAGNWVTINLEIPGARAFFGCREGMIVWRWNPHRPYLVKPWNIAAFQGPPIMGPLIHTIPIRIPKDMGMVMVWAPLTIRGPMSLGVPGITLDIVVSFTRILTTLTCATLTYLTWFNCIRKSIEWRLGIATKLVRKQIQTYSYLEWWSSKWWIPWKSSNNNNNNNNNKNKKKTQPQTTTNIPNLENQHTFSTHHALFPTSPPEKNRHRPPRSCIGANVKISQRRTPLKTHEIWYHLDVPGS